MTCPDWRTLTAARDADPAAESPAWEEARRHAAHCGRCREAALAADPLLLFARLPERQVSADEIGDMQSSVAALLRASRVGPVGPFSKDRDRSTPTLRRAFGRLGVFRVAAALGVCSLLALSGAPRSRPVEAGMFAAGGARVVQGERAEELLPLGSVVEELDRPGARIYELPQADMAVVMIVDASLDV